MTKKENGVTYCAVQITGNKTIYKTPQCCEMLTRRGLGAVLKLGQCHFNRYCDVMYDYTVALSCSHDCEALSAVFCFLGVFTVKQPRDGSWYTV